VTGRREDILIMFAISYCQDNVAYWKFNCIRFLTSETITGINAPRAHKCLRYKVTSDIFTVAKLVFVESAEPVTVTWEYLFRRQVNK
jgi:hypothetical protein